jgi:spermidine synthase
LLELLIAFSAALIPLMLPLLGGLGGAGTLVGAFLLLLLPTSLMGATLPVLTKLMTENLGTLGRTVGELYAANTAGAVLGALAAGYILVPLWGVANSLYLAVGLNIFVAALAFAQPAPTSLKAEPKTEPTEDTPWRKATLWLFACSGMIALAFEVVWTRSLSQVLGTSVYAIATILVVFLLGIAAGSGLMSSRADTFRRPEVVMGTLLVASGLAGFLGYWGLTRLPRILFWAGPYLTGFGSYLCLQLVLATAVLLPQAMSFGATLPVVTRLTTSTLNDVGSHLGKAYFFNTSGAIVGSLLGGFLLVPGFGPAVSAQILACLSIILGAAWLFWTKARRLGTVSLIAAVLLGLSFGRPDPRDSLFAVYAVPGKLKSQSHSESRRLAKRSEILFEGHGLYATVVVSEQKNIRSLSLDGWVVASTGSGDRFIEQALGLFPILLAPKTDSVLVVGLGTGITTSWAASGLAESVQVVELESQVVQAARNFEQWNHNLFTSPAVSVAVGDGRQFISSTTSEFDIITSDPIHPFSRGSASLYTVEHFKSCREKLKPGGLMVQWLPLYGLSQQDIQIVTATFLEVFPDASLWCWYPSKGREDTILLGVNGKLELDVAEIQSRLDQLSEPDIPWGRAEEVVAGFLMDGPRLAEFAGDAPVNTDNKPILEFTAPISLYHRSEQSERALLKYLLDYRPAPKT